MKFVLFVLLLIPSLSWADMSADFNAARDAFRSGNSTRLASLYARLKSSPMEPYVTYYQLRMRLDDKDSAPIRFFLAREKISPVFDQFRAEWLKYLGKKQRWDEFAAEYPKLANADAELACYALQWQRKSNEMVSLIE